MTKIAETTRAGKALAYVERIERLQAEIASHRGQYMAAAKLLREDIAEIYAEAKGAGVPTKALRRVVRSRELDRKQAALIEGLDTDERSVFEQIRDALGALADTPLGQAALDLAGSDQPEENGKGRKRKPRSPAVEPATGAAVESPEERQALDEIEREGVIAAVAGAVH